MGCEMRGQVGSERCPKQLLWFSHPHSLTHFNAQVKLSKFKLNSYLAQIKIYVCTNMCI